MPLPDIPDFPVPGQPVEAFRKRLKEFDGESFDFPSRSEALCWLKENVNTDKGVFSTIDDFEGNISLDQISDPHKCEIIDTCVSEGLMGVGETGSVWVTDKSLKVVGAGLLSLNVVLLLDKKKIVTSMHRAYAALGKDAAGKGAAIPGVEPLASTAYGSFFTGPSATADIEAVRITGAQGPLSLTVLLY